MRPRIGVGTGQCLAGGIKNTVGDPSFALFAKSGSLRCRVRKITEKLSTMAAIHRLV